MTRSSLLLVALLCSGCMTTTELQYKPGITPQQRNRDVARCTRSAERQHPVANRSSRTPRIWVPERRYCNNKGCSYHGGYYSGGHIQTQDLNLPARRRAFALCMGERGYQSVATTGCTGETREAVKRAPQGRYPRLTSESCTVGMSDGTLKVYTP